MKVPRCPGDVFQLTNTPASSCKMQCPIQQGFNFSLVDGNPMCVYTRDSNVRFPVYPLPAPQVSEETTSYSIEDLRELDPALYGQYVSETERFEKDFSLALGKIDKSKQIEDAFRDMQEAENVRDTSPQAYQDARIRYYTLTKGDAWMNQERERIAATEVAPIVDQYKVTFATISKQAQDQQKTIEIMETIKNKALSLRDDIKYSADTLSKQFNKVKDQINIERRGGEEQEKTFNWLNVIVNMVLTLVIIFVAILILQKVRARQQTSTYGVALSRG
jgi:glycerol-3-phosphate cytidylyltransferase-like family protein